MDIKKKIEDGQLMAYIGWPTLSLHLDIPKNDNGVTNIENGLLRLRNLAV